MKGMVDESRLVDWHGPFAAICILDITGSSWQGGMTRF